MNIVLVDSNINGPDILDPVQAVLKGCNIVTCFSGRAALEITRSFCPDISIIDADLPDMDFLALVEKLKQRTNNIYTIILIARDDHRDLGKAFKAGIDECILKPIDHYDLSMRLQKALFKKGWNRLLNGDAPSNHNQGEPSPVTTSPEPKPGLVKPEANQAPSQPDLNSGLAQTQLNSVNRAGPIPGLARPEPGRPEPIIQTESAGGSAPAELASVFRPQESNSRRTPPEPIPVQAPTQLSPVTDGPDSYTEPVLPEPLDPQMDDQLSVPGLQEGTGEKILPGKSAKAGRHRRTRRWYFHGARAFASAGFYVFLLLITTLSLFLVQSRMAEGVPSMLGYRVYLVPNGSTAEFDNGTMILLRETDPAQIETGDTIATGSLRSGALTFLYVARKETAGETFYTTRGSAGSSSLGSVSAANIAGKVHYAVPYVGYLLSFSQTRCGLLVLLLIPGTLVILVELRNIYKQASFFNQHKSYSFKKGGQR